MPSSSTFSTSRLGTPWTLPPGMRATRATRALARLYEARPDAALSEAEVETALATAGAAVNKVTVYRLLDRFAAAGLLHKQVDAARVTRYALAPQGGDGAAPRFECDDCHRQFRLSCPRVRPRCRRPSSRCCRRWPRPGMRAWR